MANDHRGRAVGKNHTPSPRVGQGNYWNDLVKKALVDPIQAQAQAWNTPRRNDDETLDPWDPEDIAEQQYWERARKNEALGYPEDYDGSRGY